MFGVSTFGWWISVILTRPICKANPSHLSLTRSHTVDLLIQCYCCRFTSEWVWGFDVRSIIFYLKEIKYNVNRKDQYLQQGGPYSLGVFILLSKIIPKFFPLILRFSCVLFRCCKHLTYLNSKLIMLLKMNSRSFGFYFPRATLSCLMVLRFKRWFFKLH